MILTTENSASSYGIPVFVDDAGQLMDYAPAIRDLRSSFAGSAGEALAAFASVCGVSPRTVQNWEQGRMPSPQGLAAMGRILDRRRIGELAEGIASIAEHPAIRAAAAAIVELSAD